jgi:hypothetical protein
VRGISDRVEGKGVGTGEQVAELALLFPSWPERKNRERKKLGSHNPL